MSAAPFKVAYFSANPTPYRVGFFQKVAARDDIDLTVFFLTRGSASRPWEVDPEGFEYEFLKERSIPISGKDKARYRMNFSAVSKVRKGRFDAVVALGVVIRGSTPHFDYVAAEASKGLAHCGLDAGLPVTFGVLTTDTIEQAVERAGSKAGNKGWDAALAAVEMANLLRSIDETTQGS